ncbi:MAG: amidohydrolase family protein [Candidatus Helarchaeales archaeon]
MKEPSSNKWLISAFLFLVFIVGVSIFAWITYGSIEGVLGCLAYLIIGLICVFPWIIPFAGIPLGIIDLLGIWGFRMFPLSLFIAHLPFSWMPLVYYVLIIAISTIINCIIMYLSIARLLTPKPAPKKNFALVDCKIIDGTRDGKMIKDGVILIKNIVEEGETPGLIVAVGTSDEIDIPKDYEIIDLEGKYVLPGLINTHCHLMSSGKPSRLISMMSTVSDEFVQRVVGLVKSPLVQPLIFRLMVKNALNALNSGVTTLRALGDPEYFDVKLRKKIEKGKILGPRLLVAGVPVIPTGGHGSYMGVAADTKGEIRKAVRKNIRNEVDCIKIISTGGVMDSRMKGEAGRPQMTVEEIEVACFEAHRANLLVATHCESTKGIEEALKGGVDSIDHGAEIPDELVPLFKDNPKALRGYTTLTPTISAGMGLATLPTSQTKITEINKINAELIEVGMIKALRKAYKEGIKIALGTDAGVPYSTHYQVWKELEYYVHYTDMTNQEAIYFGTKGAAEAIGIDDITGSIEVGKSADLQVVSGNPLEDISALKNVEMVMIRGHLIKNPKIKKIKAIEKNPITKIVDA